MELKECDGCSPNGGLVSGDISGMGEITFPEDGNPGSGDIPLPSGHLYRQIAPFSEFVRKRKKKKGTKSETSVFNSLEDFETYISK